VAVPFPPNKAGYYIFLGVLVPVGVAVPVVWLVMPAPAGRKVCCCSVALPLHSTGGWDLRLGSSLSPLHLLPCRLLTLGVLL
jgi:hypothetical protein